MKQTRNLILAALFAVLTALGSWIRIPTGISAFTLQIFFCAMSALLLGSRWGMVSQAVYLLLGFVGLPVFTTGGGIGVLLTPTGGFLLALVPMAWVIGRAKTRPFRGCLMGLGVLYAVGLPYMHLIVTCYLQRPWSLWQTLTYGMLVFLPWDLVKLALAAFLCKKIRPRVL